MIGKTNAVVGGKMVLRRLRMTLSDSTLLFRITGTEGETSGWRMSGTNILGPRVYSVYTEGSGYYECEYSLGQPKVFSLTSLCSQSTSTTGYTGGTISASYISKMVDSISGYSDVTITAAEISKLYGKTDDLLHTSDPKGIIQTYDDWTNMEFDLVSKTWKSDKPICPVANLIYPDSFVITGYELK